MSQRTTILGSLVVVVIGLVLFFFLRSQEQQIASNQPAGQMATEESEPKTQSRSFKELLDTGAPVQCHINETISGSRVVGSVYVGSGKMRGDFDTTLENGERVKAHMITVNETAHVWSDAAMTGIKVKLSETEKLSAEQKTQGIDPDKKYNVDCGAWVVDQSVFTLPADVTFQELNVGAAASGGTSANTEDIKKFTCSVCDQAPPGEARDRCKAQYQCN